MRRDLFSGLVLFPAALVFFTRRDPVHAAQGAAEMDMEYYIRNVFNLQSDQKAKVRTVFKSPRMIDSTFADAVQTRIMNLLGPTFSLKDFDTNIASSLPSFREFAPIVHEDNSDQYYFDLRMYCIYKQAAQILITSEERVRFRNLVGDRVLDLIMAGIPVRKATNQEEIAKGIELLLDFFQKSGQISSYVFDSSDFGDQEFADKSFQQRMPISTTIQLKEPCTVLSFIQGVKENTFFHPDIIGTTLVSYLHYCGFGGRYEDYLLDNFYRESNFDTQAQDIVLELQMKDETSFRLT